MLQVEDRHRHVAARMAGLPDPGKAVRVLVARAALAGVLGIMDAVDETVQETLGELVPGVVPAVPFDLLAGDVAAYQPGLSEVIYEGPTDARFQGVVDAELALGGSMARFCEQRVIQQDIGLLAMVVEAPAAMFEDLAEALASLPPARFAEIEKVSTGWATAVDPVVEMRQRVQAVLDSLDWGEAGGRQLETLRRTLEAVLGATG